MPDVAVVARMFAATLPDTKVKVAHEPVVCAILAVGYVVHVDAVMPDAVMDGVAQPASYAAGPVHVFKATQEHDAPPKLEGKVVVATHAAVVCSTHDDWPAPVVVVPAAHARQLPDDVYVAPPSE